MRRLNAAHVAAISCVVSSVLIFGTACSQGTDTSSTAQTQVTADTTPVTVGRITATVPAKWVVKEADSGWYVYPKYGGMVYLYSAGMSTEGYETTSLLNDFISGAKDNEGAIKIGDDRSNVSVAYSDSQDELTAFRYDMTSDINGQSYKGWLEVVPEDGWYGVIACVPDDLYDEKGAEILSILDGIMLEGEPKTDSSPKVKDETPITSTEAEEEPDVPAETEEPSPSAETPKVEEPLVFNEGHSDSNSSYTRYVGSITNVSDRTYYFVKVRGSFMDENGGTIDTDWTYACGDEGIRPGETTTFTLSVNRDDRISQISYSIYDYQV